MYQQGEKMIRSWKENNTITKMREAEGYQQKPLLFDQQVDKLIAEVSHVAEMGHISSANKASFESIINILKDMKENAKEDPALTGARRNRKGGFEGQGILPEEFRTIFLYFKDRNPINVRAFEEEFGIPEQRHIGDPSLRYNVGFCYDGKLYEIVWKEGNYHDNAREGEVLALIEHDFDELLDWEYTKTTRRFAISTLPFIKEFIRDAKEDPSIIEEYAEIGAKVNNK